MNSMFTNAFGNAGAERRIGISAAYAPRENLNLAVGLFGDNESVSRSTNTPVTDTPDESWGVNGRATWEPVFDAGKIVHLGVSGYYRTALKVANAAGDVEDAVRLSDRPNIRVDNGNIADSGIIPNVESLRYGGLEAAGVFGPLTVAGEAGRLWLDRNGFADEHFTGFYGYAAYMLGLFERTPRFVKRFDDLATRIGQAAAAYAAEVRSRSFPTTEQMYQPKPKI